ncbi:MAG: hypothetical protein LBD88_04005 [Candidatus Peribacteria bacterium]|nr:hypothetical protein [Candidatus Peribacteria bacterium]
MATSNSPLSRGRIWFVSPLIRGRVWFSSLIRGRVWFSPLIRRRVWFISPLDKGGLRGVSRVKTGAKK